MFEPLIAVLPRQQQPPLPNPHDARWRRWSARSRRHRAEHGRWLPPLAREPCWETPPARAAHRENAYVDVRDIVRPYVTAYLREERPT
ncbi:hypothetical protein [Streptomyces blattellae]|uniref:hypothetical protein n=1 Tax=Streptomyces blattellae TaxID=2569855 RepID=UPI0012B8B7C6|nr:hypothetical protein [Streptomyces blattellae]